MYDNTDDQPYPENPYNEDYFYDYGVNYCRSDKVDAHKDCHEDYCTCWCHGG